MNNDFKNNYKKEMDEQTPSPDSLKRLASAMSEKENEKKAKRFSRKAIRRIIAVAACVALLACAALPIGLHMRGDDFGRPSYTDFIGPSSSLDPVTMENYDEIYKVISEAKREYFKLYDEAIDMAIPERVPTERVPTDIMPTMPGVSQKPTADSKKDDYLYNDTDDGIPDFSDTNLQEAGVQEADIIKTDGRYIYAVSEDYLHIIEAKDGSLTPLSKISRRAGEDENAPISLDEMYVSGDRLILIKSIWKKEERLVDYPTKYTPPFEPYVNDTLSPDKPIDIDGDNISDPVVLVPEIYFRFVGYGVDIYDISDRSEPKFVNTVTQDGHYISSRMIGDTLYLITNKRVYEYDQIDISSPETFIPIVGGKLLTPDCIYIAKNAKSENAQYLIVSGIDTKGNGEIISSKSLFGYGSNVYCSADNLYVTAYAKEEHDGIISNATKIFKFSLYNGNVELAAEGKVPGTVLNQFSLDEKDGNLRLVTTFSSYKYEELKYEKPKDGDYYITSITDSKEANCLYVLDEKLSVIGKLEDLAPNERIYSARFDGNIAYFVTFRNVDPLFTVDLSNPKDPKILSELKIPGFSEYLHPWSNTLLFGFGNYANPTTGQSGELKLSMFDVSDKTNVREAQTLTLYGSRYSAASYNHKAILINSSKNIIAFPADGEKYLVYSFTEEGGFKKEAEIRISDDVYYSGVYYSEMRGLFIGDFLYVYSSLGIASYSMNDYNFVDSVNLD